MKADKWKYRTLNHVRKVAAHRKMSTALAGTPACTEHPPPPPTHTQACPPPTHAGMPPPPHTQACTPPPPPHTHTQAIPPPPPHTHTQACPPPPPHTHTRRHAQNTPPPPHTHTQACPPPPHTRRHAPPPPPPHTQACTEPPPPPHTHTHTQQGRHRTPSQGVHRNFAQENTKKFADSELARRFPFSRRRHFERKQLQRLFKCGDLTNLLATTLNYLFLLFQTNTQHADARVDSSTRPKDAAYTCTRVKIVIKKIHGSRETRLEAGLSASVGTPPPFKVQGADAAPKAVGGE